MYMDETTRDELLIRLDERMAAVHKEIFGNGRPGLLTLQAEDRAAIRELRSDMEQFTTKKVEEVEARAIELAKEVKADTPSKGGQRFAQVGTVAALIVAVWQGVNAALKS